MTLITMLVLLALALVVVVLAVRSIRVIPAEHAAIVERLGRYQRTVPAGLTFTVPVIDRVRTPLVDLNEQVIQGERSLATADSHLLSVSTTAHVRVIDPQAATYQVADYRAAIDLLITTTLRNLLGDMTLDEALASRAEFIRALLNALSTTRAWGVHVDRVEISDFRRPRTGLVE